jgi:olfactory receptor
MFLVIYLINLLQTVGMIILMRMDPQLHTSKYFYLSHLSFSDFYYFIAIVLKVSVGIFG